MDNMFKNTTKVLKTINNVKYTTDDTMPDWVALRLIEIQTTGYSGTPKVNTISATSFNKSDKQILLGQQKLVKDYPTEVSVNDIQNSTAGTILHEALLGEESPRTFKTIEVNDVVYSISGQCDRIEYVDGGINIPKTEDTKGVPIDLKHVSIYSYLDFLRESEVYPQYNDMSLEDLFVKCPTIFKYKSQISIYNWLYNLQSDVGYIQFIFNNWTFAHQSTVPSKNITLELKLADSTKVSEYLTKRLDKLSRYQESGYLPDCPDSALGKKTTYTYKVVKPGTSRAINGTGGSHNTLNAASIAQSEVSVLSEIKTIVNSSEATLCMKYCQFNLKGVCEQGVSLKEMYKGN